MVLMSVVKSGPVMAKRRPLTRTRLRWGPKSRRFRVAVPIGEPAWTVLAVGLFSCEPVNCGVSVSMTSRFCVPDSFSSWASTTVTGVGALKPRLDRRDPVTTTVVLSAAAGADAWVAPGWGSF